MAKTKRSYKHLNEDRFNAVRTLLQAKVKGSKIADTLNISSGTVSNIKRCATFAEYKSFTAKRNEDAKMRKAMEAPKQTPETPKVEALDNALLETIVAQNDQMIDMMKHLVEHPVVHTKQRLFSRV